MKIRRVERSNFYMKNQMSFLKKKKNTNTKKTSFILLFQVGSRMKFL